MRVIYILAILIVFVTTYILIIPAITMTRADQVLDCQYQVHHHTEDCYEEDEDGTLRLVCGYADYVIHEHSDDCYDAEGNLICPLPEITEPLEDEPEQYSTAYTSGPAITLKTGLHTHTNACYDEEGHLICGRVQLQAHTHGPACFYTVDPVVEELPTETYCAKTSTMQVTVFADAGAFPAGTKMIVKDVEEASVLDTITEAVDGEVVYIHAVDITFYCDGEEIEPSLPIQVTMTLLEEPEVAEQSVVHLDQEGEASIVEQERSADTEVIFTSDSFSIYAVVGTKLEQSFLASDGNKYKVKLVYGQDAGIPDDASLDVTEILRSSPEYKDYVADAEEALGLEAGSVRYARFFDITILNGDGEEIQPAEGASVDVSIRLMDRDEVSETSQIVHFEDDPEIMDYTTDGDTVSFRTGSFSVYGIVDAPAPTANDWHLVESLDELEELGEAGLYVRHADGYYFTNATGTISGTRTGIKKTKPAADSPDDADAKDARPYYFTKVGDDQYIVHCYDKNGDLQYVKQSTNSMSFTTQDDATVFTVSEFPGAANTFRVLGTDGYYWNMTHGTGGSHFAAYNDATDTNARIQFQYATIEDDPYGLDGATFGIAYQDNTATAAALMTENQEADGTQRLTGEDMLMRPDVLDNEGILLVAKDSDITEWTFHSVSEDKYYITAEVDGQMKYLNIDGVNVTLEDTPQDGSLITATPGTGENSGKWQFTSGTYALNLFSDNTYGLTFGAKAGDRATAWMNLVERSILEDDDFQLYAAKKVSVSDTVQVPDGAKLIIYTRIWNDTKKRYEFYAIDHDGSLVRCYDGGDVIEWVGSKVNTAVWDFTEYHYSDGTPNYYYEFQNEQYGKYIAPQMTNSQILSDSTLGVNLTGRRNGEDYTTIVAWDDTNYQYVGLKTENGRIVSCPLKDAEDFYFAIIQPVDPVDPLSTANTIDNNEYGITMKMVDFNNAKTGRADSPRDTKQTYYLGKNNADTNVAGLVSTNLGSDGYPVTTSATDHEGLSLAGLFTGSSTPLESVNHLFLESIHNESGYFEYDSTQNFAHLNADKNFTVYDQLGAIGDYISPTNEHGQFMPYDDLYEADGTTPREACDQTNNTNVLAQPLPDADPRKGETLYNIGNRDQVDYHFGMVMEASFTQTANGLDAWGHDIIFEFSGDDDFWLYVDGELVLDLGGVHPAMDGSINFKTGQVHSNRAVMINGVSKKDYTLREVFESNYRSRNPGATDAQVAEYLDGYFKDGGTVFKDYTNHTMKMFYMERGSGASNLHMRFNLAAVKPGTFILSKKLSGTESSSSSLIEFPYQIWYYLKNDPDPDHPTKHLLGENSGETEKVLYSGTSTPVRYQASFTPAGGTEAYSHVFFLKPGQSAEIEMPDNVKTYWVTECGINPDVYDHVYANNTELSGTATVNLAGSTPRNDYSISPDTLENRSKVEYDNHVKEGSIRTLNITKKLYDKDGTTVLHYPQNPDSPTALEDPQTFSFRLYLGDENANPNNLPLANMYSYHVKDSSRNYCVWDVAKQRFVSLGKTEFAELTDEEKEAATFATSMNGSISKIPTDHTVEVRDLIVSTQFKVEERENEIPKGYTLRQSDGYMRIDAGHEQNNEDTPISGVIQVQEDPQIQVSNQIGWGLTAEKVWTDKDFMDSHDTIYFAIYLKGTLLQNTLRRIVSPETSLYYFFHDLDSESKFSDYAVREVKVTFPAGVDPVVDSEGYVQNAVSVDPIDENGTLTLGGTPKYGTHQDGYSYTVNYTVGTPTGHNENVRVDTVTNSRPGIEIYKTDLGDSPLAGAVFTLKDEQGHDMGLSTYTSEADGLVTIAYLPAGTFYLTETTSPHGYIGLDAPLKITVGNDNSVALEGPLAILYELRHNNPNMIAAIQIKNRPTGFRAVKVDTVTGLPISGTHFALYPQVTTIEGELVKDYLPISGMEDLVTDENGIIPQITMELGAGTYYLTEVEPSSGYAALSGDICFTIGVDGTVTHVSGGEESWLSMVEDASTHNVSYLYTVPNAHYELPSTGGSGGFALQMHGAVIALIAAAFFRFRRKKYDR